MLLGSTSGAGGPAAGCRPMGRGLDWSTEASKEGGLSRQIDIGRPGKFGFQINRIILNINLSHTTATLTKYLLFTRDSDWSVSFVW